MLIKTLDLELAHENRLSMWKRKGLSEYIRKNIVSNRRNGDFSHEHNPGMFQELNGRYFQGNQNQCRPKKSQLDSVASLRKQAAIIESGAYSRDTIAPPKGRGKMNTSECMAGKTRIIVSSEITDRQKDELIHQMAYGCPPPNNDYEDAVLKKKKKTKHGGMEVSITPRSRQAECM